MEFSIPQPFREYFVAYPDITPFFSLMSVLPVIQE